MGTFRSRCGMVNNWNWLKCSGYLIVSMNYSNFIFPSICVALTSIWYDCDHAQFNGLANIEQQLIPESNFIVCYVWGSPTMKRWQDIVWKLLWDQLIHNISNCSTLNRSVGSNINFHSISSISYAFITWNDFWSVCLTVNYCNSKTTCYLGPKVKSITLYVCKVTSNKIKCEYLKQEK